MGKSERAANSRKTAEDLASRGFPHGVRQSRPMPNSGGLTMTDGPGSSRAQRMRAKGKGSR